MIHAAAPYLYWNQELILIALDAVALQVRMHLSVSGTHRLKRAVLGRWVSVAVVILESIFPWIL